MKLSGNPISGTSPTATASDADVGPLQGIIHDRGHDHHKRDAKTKTAAMMRLRSRLFPRRVSWSSATENCDGSLMLPISASTSDALPLAIPVESSIFICEGPKCDVQ